MHVFIKQSVEAAMSCYGPQVHWHNYECNSGRRPVQNVGCVSKSINLGAGVKSPLCSAFLKVLRHMFLPSLYRSPCGVC